MKCYLKLIKWRCSPNYELDRVVWLTDNGENISGFQYLIKEAWNSFKLAWWNEKWKEEQHRKKWSEDDT